MKETTMVCSVCCENIALGVFASRIAPVSCAYCKKCMERRAEPYGVLVTKVAHLMSQNPDYQLSPRLIIVKLATLSINDKTEEMFIEDVRNRML
ncbi:hypothetical protein [Paenisporosarcina sp. NPDC076898]|uniref:hypothetical protein n=1 Tax=unclassified Paenisporosarcina TaxID=2642018 RepID=UPI003CFEB4FE